MKWSPKQSTALSRIDNWLKRGDEPRFALGGYAGTGKSTLAKHIADNFGGVVKYGAFTGKAASVLRSKGCPGATTIHKLIYAPKGDTGSNEIENLQGLIEEEALKDRPDQAKIQTWRYDLERAEANSSAMFERKQESAIHEADLVIIDESSMVDKRMGEDLESYGVPILYLGDPGQLGPVKGAAHLTENRYDFVLDEIHRQAADSPIIWLSNEVRQGRAASFGSFGDGQVRIERKADWDMQAVVDADQVITGMNLSKKRITSSMRRFIGYDKIYPLANDKLICCRNDHEIGLLNGVTCRALAEGRMKGNIIYLDVEYDGNDMKGMICDPGYFQATYGNRVNFPSGDGIQHFDYGYCITGHKSQGSQWRSVVIADDKMRANDRVQRKRWLYTTITRAEEELLIYV